MRSNWRRLNPVLGDVVLYHLSETTKIPAVIIGANPRGLILRVLARNADINRDDVAFSADQKTGCWSPVPDPQGPFGEVALDDVVQFIERDSNALWSWVESLHDKIQETL